MANATFRIWRGEHGTGSFVDYPTETSEGMVVLDAVHQIQAEQAPDLAVRWNCKAGKCGSCSAEINGHPKLMCMTRLSELDLGQPVSIEVDAYGGREFKGRIDSIAAATGARFSLLPPDNASGNFVKVVQRVPVKIAIDEAQDPEHLLRPGMSVTPTVYTR